MTTDNERMLRLNLAGIVIGQLTTTPGGLASMRGLMLDSRPGPRSPNLEPSRGGRPTETVQFLQTFPNGNHWVNRIVEIPCDPTGEAAIHPDLASGDLDELDDLLDTLHTVVLDLAAMRDRWTPITAPKVSDGDGFTKDFCKSCWRVSQTCTPITRRPDGRAYYAGMCRWCGTLRQDLGMKVGSLPPRRLVELHVAGQPITRQVLDLYRHPPAKRRRKGKRGRRAA